MIKNEDKELQRFVLSGESCIAVPFEVYLADKEPEITVYDGFEAVAENFVGNFGADLFSAEALNYINNSFKTFAESIGFVHYPSEDFIQCEYMMNDISQLHKELILPGTKIISSGLEFERYENLADRDVEISDDGDEGAAVHIVDGCITSLAGINDISDDNGASEINVITAENYRGRGFGASSVTALCEYLISEGQRVSYKYRDDNAASAALCQKCGFQLVGKRYSYVCYAKEDT